MKRQDVAFHTRTDAAAVSRQSISRRDFIGQGIGLLAAAGTVPAFLGSTCLALGGGGNSNRVLVVIQLSGGNDGLNMVVPFSDDAYYRARPRIAIPPQDVLRLTDDIGLHPDLQPLQRLYDRGELAVVQGVGYPNPDRSHFRSMEIWHTAVADEFSSSGWLGRLFDHTCGNQHLSETCSPTLGITVDKTLSPAFTGASSVGIALNDAERFYRMTRLQARSTAKSAPVDGGGSQLDFLRRTALNAELAAGDIRDAVRSAKSTIDYPQNPFGRSLQLIAGMIAGGLDTRVYYTSLSGFDTHANQPAQHSRLLKTLASGIEAFTQDLRASGQLNRVLGMTFSEFGRRLAENGSNGTDHGKAAPLFMFGSAVRPGVVGGHPSLTELSRGDLQFHTDFRRVYATVIDDWLGVDAAAVLADRYATLPLLG